MRDNLLLRGNTYHVRLALPADVRPFFGNRSLLSQSLKTGLQQEAKDRARVILLEWKDRITQARQIQASQAEQWREELAVQGAAQDVKFSNALMAHVKGVPPEGLDVSQLSKDHLIALFAASADRFLDLSRDIESSGVDGFYNRMKGLLRSRTQQGSSLQLLSDASALFTDARARLAAKKYKLTPEEIAEAATLLANPKTYKPKSPISTSMLDSWAVHLATQIKTAKTRDRLKKSMQRFSDYLTSEGMPLSFDTVHSFLGTLPEARATRANYLWAGRTFWKWANKYQQVFREQFDKLPCPFDGHELAKTGEAAGRKRLAFTQQQIEALHVKALEKGSTPLANLIQFAAYTGARLEEIGRIRPEHTIFNTSGEPVGFKITESKTDAGVRDMPLHPDLTPLFRELSAKASENEGFLFAGGQNKYGNRLDMLSKQFGRLKSSDYGKDHTFHSIRHSVTTLLVQQGIHMDILPYILGHETGSFTLSQYSKGPSFEQKQEAIKLIEFNF